MLVANSYTRRTLTPGTAWANTGYRGNRGCLGVRGVRDGTVWYGGVRCCMGDTWQYCTLRYGILRYGVLRNGTVDMVRSLQYRYDDRHRT